MTKLGIAAVLLYLPHAAWLVVHGTPWDLLWMCDAAMPLLACGCFARKPRLVVTAFLFLIFGTPLWLLDVVAGGHMVITSPLIHIGGIVVGYRAVRAMGWPVQSWAVASLTAAVVLGLSRLLSPREANINMAFRVYEGWEKYFSSHSLYVLGLWLSATAIFWFVERGALSKHLKTRRT
jgi:hypothetical protein